ncbi:hypothetical protein Tco_0410851 [Tanacetum coccineum]
MYYPRVTKVIINHFMSQDKSIPRRNNVNWHMANDDPILTTMRFIPQHDVFQKYGAILPNNLTNQAMKESEAYKTYYGLAIRKMILKPKLKTTAKVAKSGKKKLPAQGLETLSEIAQSEAEQMKIAIERSKTQLHSSHASGSSADEGTGVIPGIPDVPTYRSEDEQISWKPSDDEDDDEVSESKYDDDNADNDDDDGQDDVNDQTESDNDGDDFVHPKFSTHDEEERRDEEDKEEEGVNVEGEELNEEETNEEEEVNELYRDVNVNLEGRETEMTDAPQTNQSSSVSSGFISNMLNLNSDTGIDSILNMNTESTSLVDLPITTNVEMPPSSFEDKVKALEDDFLEFKQTNLFADVVSSIPGIVDTYLANKMNEAVKTAVQLQSNKLRSEAQADNEDFINKIDENMKKVIKEQVKVQVKEQVSNILPRIKKLVNDQLEAEVLIRSSNKAKTSHDIAANLSELELKKIRIDKIENNKSIHRSVQQEALYKALVDAYETDKDILETYGDTGSKRRRVGKEPESTSAPKEKTSKSTGKSKDQAEEQTNTIDDLEEPANQEFDTGFPKDQPVDETTQHPDCTLARNEDPRDSFNELMDTPLDFSVFVVNRLKVDTLTPKLLAGPAFELMKGHQYPHDLGKPLPLIPNSQGRRVIPFDHFINNDLAYLSGGVSSRTYTTSVTKTKAADYGEIKWMEDLVPNTMWSCLGADSLLTLSALENISSPHTTSSSVYHRSVTSQSATFLGHLYACTEYYRSTVLGKLSGGGGKGLSMVELGLWDKREEDDP